MVYSGLAVASVFLLLLDIMHAVFFSGPLGGEIPPPKFLISPPKMLG